MEQQASYFGILPAEVRYNKDITDFAKILYAEFMALSNTYGYCFATNKYFAELYDKDAMTISKTVAQLKKYNLIHVEIIDSFQRKIYPLVGIGVSQKDVGGYAKTSMGIDENVYNNNKYNNKDNINITRRSKTRLDTPSKEKKTTRKVVGKTFIENITAPYYQLPENFNWNELLKVYSDHENYVLNILAYYCQVKGIRADTWGEAKTILSRHTKGAQAIKDFPVEKIKKVMDKLNRDMPHEFTLETVYKYLTK